jgi:hypothetical protein
MVNESLPRSASKLGRMTAEYAEKGGGGGFEAERRDFEIGAGDSRAISEDKH